MVGDTKGKKVFVGLSGGVDSAVSAALLKNQGYEVVGVFITIQIPGYPCPAAADRRDAMRVAAYLDIPFLEIDLSKEYERDVLRPSVEEFKKGRTPNPDTLCNEKIKFGPFFDFCRAQGADYVATGHYARMKNEELYISKDHNKDQTYFLWQVPQEALQHVFFPIGDKTKKEVRMLAKRYGLPNATRPDSQGLCFLGDISLSELLTRELEPVPGDILNEAEEVVGKHRGAALYTIGERHGFEFFAKGPDTVPHFVVAKDVEHNTLTISTSRYPKGARQTKLELSHTNWIGAVEEGRVEARFRYRQKLIAAKLATQNDGRAQVTLDRPHYTALGQSLVLYNGQRCLGGGVIESATLTG